MIGRTTPMGSSPSDIPGAVFDEFGDHADICMCVYCIGHVSDLETWPIDPEEESDG